MEENECFFLSKTVIHTAVSMNARGKSGKLFPASVAEPGVRPVLVSRVAVGLPLLEELQAVRENKCG